MRHRIYGKQLNRKSEHRIAMLRNLAAGLFEHGQIETTMPKAKAVQPLVEKIITIAKDSPSLHARRQLARKLNDRRIFSWVADPNVKDERKAGAWFDLPSEESIEFNRYGELRKAPRLIEHILKTVAPRYKDRDGGYTRIIKLDKHRLGDGTDLVLLQLVGDEDGPQVGGGLSGRRRQADRRTAFAARLRKESGAEEAEASTAVAESEEPVVEDEAPAAEETTEVQADASAEGDVETTSEESSEEQSDATEDQQEKPE
ncbi:MAG: 50S ribosomal protein L17 [Phycisphaerae bacterium]|nr:50S ribosomal protein L17 [Phycisphaerae bacterium]